ncbi:MAG: tetratricopeptide repeat protein [Bacteroidales bacterium]|nr:tetratricopeptide repeat protein [Bacteroidales bacterium]
MKRKVILAALLAASIGVSAQTMKVQSAYSDMKNDRWRNAMANIEEACVNEKTKDDAKTWNYAGLIYAKFVELSTSTDPKDQKLFKKQKVDTPIEQLADKAQDALIKSMELEKKAGTNEFATSNNGALIVVSGYQLDRAINFFNEGKYEECIPLFEKAATAAKACGQGDILNRSKLVMAMAYDALKQKDKAVEIYRELVKSGAKEKEAYINLYVANVANKEMDKAINVLKKGVKVMPKDPQMKALLGGAYLQAGNRDEAEKVVNDLLAMGADNPEILNYVGGIYRDADEIAKAEEYYNKSLTIKADQTDAYLGLGTTYFNKGIATLKEAEKVPLDDMTGAYDKMKNEAFDLFKQAIPNFNKVLETKPNDFQSLKALRNIYSLLNMKAEFQAIDAKLKQSN